MRRASETARAQRERDPLFYSPPAPLPLVSPSCARAQISRDSLCAPFNFNEQIEGCEQTTVRRQFIFVTLQWLECHTLDSIDHQRFISHGITLGSQIQRLSLAPHFEQERASRSLWQGYALLPNHTKNGLFTLQCTGALGPYGVTRSGPFCSSCRCTCWGAHRCNSSGPRCTRYSVPQRCKWIPTERRY